MKRNTLPWLWYENEAGEKWVPEQPHCGEGVPEGYRFMYARSPCQLEDTLFDGHAQIMTGRQTYSEDLALALARPIRLNSPPTSASIPTTWRTSICAGRSHHVTE